MTAQPVLTPASRVRLLPWFARQEQEAFVVGAQATGSTYLAVPPIGVAAMRLLDDGLTLGQAAEQLADAHGVDPDLEDFVHTLAVYGLVAEIDGIPLTAPPPPPPPGMAGIALFAGVRPERVRWLVHPATQVAHLLALVAAVVLIWRQPGLWPDSRDWVVHPWFAVNTLLVAATGLPLLVAHELGHLLTARAYGLAGRISIGRRLRDVVLQCDLADIWRLPRRHRAVVFATGMAVNLWTALAALVVLAGWGPELAEPLRRWLALVVLVQWLGIAWQANAYLETDGYYLLADLLGAKRLMVDTRAWLRHLAGRLAPNLGPGGSDLAHLPARERRAVHAFSVVYLVGVVWSLAVFAIWVLPYAATATIRAVAALAAGPAAGAVRLADAAITLLVMGAAFGLLARLAWQDAAGRRTRRTGQPPPA